MIRPCLNPAGTIQVQSLHLPFCGLSDAYASMCVCEHTNPGFRASGCRPLCDEAGEGGEGDAA